MNTLQTTEVGDIEVKIDRASFLGVNHTLAYETTGPRMAEMATREANILRGYNTFAVTVRNPVSINGVEYRLSARVTRLGVHSAFNWDGVRADSGAGMTDAAQRKVAETFGPVNDQIVAFIDTNLNALRQQAIDAYKASVEESIRVVRDNLTLLEQALNNIPPVVEPEPEAEIAA
jgi:hypothetical protein